MRWPWRRDPPQVPMSVRRTGRHRPEVVQARLQADLTVVLPWLDVDGAAEREPDYDEVPS